MSTSVGATSTIGPSTTAASTTSSANTLNPNDFLTLLTAQLQNQDPLNPIDDTQSVAELAQFESVSSTNQLANNFQAFQSNFAVTQAASLIGQTVTVSTGTSTATGSATSAVTGTVSAVSIVNGSPLLTLTGPNGPITGANGAPLTFPTSSILSISPAGTGI
jgi:flagellar basal-body rod modification protein FlgD